MAPPRPRCCLNVGITGHRLNRLTASDLARAKPVLAHLLDVIVAATSAVYKREAACFADTPPEFRFLSGLAEGSDQIAGDIALHHGFALHALLPFEREAYAADFETDAATKTYRDLLAQSSRVFELPGRRDAGEHAYKMMGSALVAHADVVIALWDGDAAHGMGGTAEVVAMALGRGIPVIHMHPDGHSAPRILWSGLEAFPIPHDSLGDYGSQPYSDALLDTVIARLIAPAEGTAERGCIAQYCCESERRYRLRIEYPLLLAIAGVRRLGRATFRSRPYAEAAAAEWAGYRKAVQNLGISDDATLDDLQAAYAWSDNLANHFAQVFRSGHVLNFALTALAVLLALSGLLFPAAKFWLIVTELGTISLLVVNTQIGRASQWHRRWLDYRYLAECLRPMRSLKLYGVVASGARRPVGSAQPMRWPDWYAAAWWRQIGAPAGRVDNSNMRALNALVAAEELAPQIGYHRATAQRMRTLEHRLHRVGSVLFATTIAACVVFLTGYFVAHDWTVAHAPLFTAITAALPALGGAIYGIRVQGDFGGAGSRSAKAAISLEQLRTALAAEPPPEFTQAAALAEAGARVMLSDLTEWQMTYRQRVLAIPA